MENTKKKMKEAELRVVQFELNDVIVASGGCNSDNPNPCPSNYVCAYDRCFPAYG